MVKRMPRSTVSYALRDIQQDDSAAAALGGALGDDHEDLCEGIPDVLGGEEGRVLRSSSGSGPMHGAMAGLKRATSWTRATMR
eukprot:364737-Chlamydomonas_euryale.AAC.5